jgi:hypothetical protein
LVGIRPVSDVVLDASRGLMPGRSPALPASSGGAALAGFVLRLPGGAEIELDGPRAWWPDPSIKIDAWEDCMSRLVKSAVYGGAALAFTALLGWSSAVHAQTTLTMSSWVPPTHLITKDVLLVWANNV